MFIEVWFLQLKTQMEEILVFNAAANIMKEDKRTTRGRENICMCIVLYFILLYGKRNLWNHATLDDDKIFRLTERT